MDGGSTGMRGRPLWFFDGTPISNDGNISQYNRTRGPLIGARANKNVMFAVERGYDAEAQVMGMRLEGIDIAVLFPTAGLSFLARDNMDPQLSNAICRAYNDWLHDFCQHSPDQLKMAAMLPMHDVNLACQELYRCVKEYGAVGTFVRPNYLNGRYWHSTYWDPLYGMLQDLNIPLCFHEGTGSYYSTIEPRFGENRFMRHVASHSTEMQLALIALMLGGIFEFFPGSKSPSSRRKAGGYRAFSAGWNGICASITTLTHPTSNYRRSNTGSATASRRSRAASAKSARSSSCWAEPTISACRPISRISTPAFPTCRTGC
jgi:hypothetical protein